MKESTSKSEVFEIRVKVNPKEIFNACVELITINSMPMSIVESPAFKRVLKPYVTALELKGIKLIINRRNILKHIQKKADQLKEIIMLEVKNKYLCLMIDIGSRYNRSIFGINVAYMQNSKVRIYTIGMHPLQKCHNAENLRDVIKDKLNEYNISLNQIFSITSDNGANLLKTIALLDANLQQEKISNNDDDGVEQNDMNESGFDSDFETDNDIFDDQYFEDLLNGVRMQFNALVYSDLIQGVSCAAHCFHLIVTKAIEKSPITTELLKK